MPTKSWEQALGRLAVKINAVRGREASKIMRNSVTALRETMFVVAMHFAFRAMLFLRRCNY